jgi:hypothetical protein
MQLTRRTLAAVVGLILALTSHALAAGYHLCDSHTFKGPIAADDRTSAYAITQIVVTPDGSMWGTEAYAARLVHVTPSGKILEIALSAEGGSADLLAVDAYGTLAFSEFKLGPTQAGSDLHPAVIGVRHANQAIVEHRLPASVKKINGVAISPDGSVWFVASDGIVGRIRNGRIWTKTINRNWNLNSLAIDDNGHAWIGVGNDESPSRILELNGSGALTSHAVPISYIEGVYFKSRRLFVNAVRGGERSICSVRTVSPFEVDFCAQPSGKRFAPSPFGTLIVAGTEDERLMLVQKSSTDQVFKRTYIADLATGSGSRVWLNIQPLNTLVTGTLCK